MTENLLVVVKIGGDVFELGRLHPVVSDVAALVAAGHRVLMVHGGGPQATHMQQLLGIEPNIVAGRRITDEPTLDVMKMVVAGRLNVDLCGALLRAGAKPVGLHAASSRVVRARRRPPRIVAGGGPDPIDFGLVGDVTGLNERLLSLLLSAGYTPVIPSLGADEEGNVLNINADIIANEAAMELSADHLVLVTRAPGVLRDVNDSATRIPRMTIAEARAAIANGSAAGGMIPKLTESIRVLSRHPRCCIHIVGGLGVGDLNREIETPGSVGTALVAARVSP